MLTKRRCVKTPASKMKLSLKVSGIKNSNYGCEQRHCGRQKTWEIFFLSIFFFIWIEHMMMQQRTRGCLLYFPVCFFFFLASGLTFPPAPRTIETLHPLYSRRMFWRKRARVGVFFNEISMGRRRAAEEERGSSCCHTRNFSPFAQRQLIKGHGDSTSLN